MKNGILAGGNWIIDLVKVIDAYPTEEKLVNILAEYKCNGGSPYNICKALFKLGAGFPLSAIGRIGNDESGEIILQDCAAMGVNTAQLRRTAGVNTAYTDVMLVQSTGKRTFFHQRGANAFLDVADFGFEKTTEKIFHLGYLLLLDQLDKPGPNGHTAAADVLKKAKQQGFLTSVDLVSEYAPRFKAIVPPSLPYVDYLFVNEFEAQMLTGITTTAPAGTILLEPCYQAAAAILDMGVQQWVILHFPEGAVAMDRSGEKIFQPAVQLPADKIAGALGVGDAFAAGVLLGVHHHWPMERALQLAVCAAASCLFQTTSSDGILPVDECLQLAAQYGYKTF